MTTEIQDGRHDRSARLYGGSAHQAIHTYLWGWGDSLFSSFFYHHHLEILSQSIEPTVERFSYILRDSYISSEPHLLTLAISSIYM